MINSDEFRNRGWQVRLRELASWRRGFLWMLAAAVLAVGLVRVGDLIFPVRVVERIVIATPNPLVAQVVVATPVAINTATPTTQAIPIPTRTAPPAQERATAIPTPTIFPMATTRPTRTPVPTKVWTAVPTPTARVIIVIATPTPVPAPYVVETYSEQRGDGSIWEVQKMSNGAYRQRKVVTTPTPILPTCRGEMPVDRMVVEIRQVPGLGNHVYGDTSLELYNRLMCPITFSSQTNRGRGQQFYQTSTDQVIRRLAQAGYDGPWDLFTMINAYNRMFD